MKLAAQLFTIREFTKTPEDIYKSFKKIRDIGYDYIQVSAFGKIEPKQLKEYADEFNLKICATHTPYDRILNDTEKVIAEHKLWNCDYIGLGSMPPEYRCTKEGCDAFLKEVAPAVDKIYDAGLKFMYHNHNFEFNKIDGNLNTLEYFSKKTDENKFGFLADFYWIQAGGLTPVEFINKYAKRLDVVHFKDLKVIESTTITMCEIFSGNMDYQKIYDECKKCGVKYVAVEQDKCPGDPFDSLKISYNNIKAHNMF